MKTLHKKQPQKKVMVLVAIILSLVAVQGFASPAELSVDDIRIFHRGWSTWVGLFDDYEYLTEKLPEPVARSEDEIMSPIVGGRIYLDFKDTMLTLFFIGEYILQLTTSSSEVVTPRGVVIGSDRNYVVGAYGPPWRVKQTEEYEVYQYRTRTTADPFNWRWMVLSFGFNDHNNVAFIEFFHLSSTVE